MEWLDLTRVLDAETPVYPGDPPPVIQCAADFKADGFYSSCITLGMHTGTHLDAPRHFIENGAWLSDIPIHQFFGRGVLVDARGQSTIGLDAVAGANLQRQDIVLVMTGWSQHFGTPQYYQDYPPLSVEFAERMVAAGIKIIGLDSPSPDHPPYPIHKLLLANQVLIIENLCNLAKLVGVGTFDVAALPAKFAAEAAPVRVVASWEPKRE